MASSVFYLHAIAKRVAIAEEGNSLKQHINAEEATIDSVKCYSKYLWLIPSCVLWPKNVALCYQRAPLKNRFAERQPN